MYLCIAWHIFMCQSTLSKKMCRCMQYPQNLANSPWKRYQLAKAIATVRSHVGGQTSRLIMLTAYLNDTSGLHVGEDVGENSHDSPCHIIRYVVCVGVCAHAYPWALSSRSMRGTCWCPGECAAPFLAGNSMQKLAWRGSICVYAKQI